MAEKNKKARSSSSRQTGAPTIADVAALAGVSMMTVSRVINAEPKVRQSTRDQVRAAIAELNYAPNRAARSLAGAAQVRLVLLYSNPSEAYLSAFLVGSLDAASRMDVQLVVQKCDADAKAEELIELMAAKGFDGVILPPPLCDSPRVWSALDKAGLPAVAVATASAPPEMAAVSIDDRRAAFEMTAHLVALGHERIGFIAGDPDLSASAERLEGYREALAAGRIAWDDELIAQGFYSYRSGLDAAEKLLSLDNPPSAVFASNDDMAAATVAIAHRRGFDVPGDITVCGFDDSALATTIWPELTTIHQPIAEMSRAAVEMLTAHVRGKQKTQEGNRHRVLDYTFVRRQSDAAPRRRPASRVSR